MFNYVEQVMEQYGLDILETARSRGAYTYRTRDGLYLLKTVYGSEEKWDLLYEVQEYLHHIGFAVDRVCRNREGQTSAKDAEGSRYLLLKTIEGREIDYRNRQELNQASAHLANVHKALADFPGEIPAVFVKEERSYATVFEKHLRELKKIKNYMHQKRKKNEFERAFLAAYPDFSRQAEMAAESLLKETENTLQNPSKGKENMAQNPPKETENMAQNPSKGTESTAQNPSKGTESTAQNPSKGTESTAQDPSTGKENTAQNPSKETENMAQDPPKETKSETLNGGIRKGLMHGECTQHNILLCGNTIGMVSWEGLQCGVQIWDLSQYLRKIMEKNNWNLTLGMEIVEHYERQRPITRTEKRRLYQFLAFPEKYWKIANHYYNSAKSWGAGRSAEKLEKMVAQEDNRLLFLELLRLAV